MRRESNKEGYPHSHPEDENLPRTSDRGKHRGVFDSDSLQEALDRGRAMQGRVGGVQPRQAPQYATDCRPKPTACPCLLRCRRAVMRLRRPRQRSA